MCQDFAPKVDPDLINHSSCLVNRFGPLHMCDGDDVSSFCASIGLFDRALSHPVLSYMGILVVAGVCLDVSGQILYLRGDLVWAGSRMMVPVDTGDGGGGAGPVVPPISTRECTVVHGQGGWVTCIWIVYTRQGSVLQVTGSLLLQILLCCLFVVCIRLCLSLEGKQTCCKYE